MKKAKMKKVSIKRNWKRTRGKGEKEKDEIGNNMKEME